MPFNDEQRNAIAQLLPKYLPAERFLSLCQLAERSYALRECTPQSILSCLIEAAKIGLEPNTPLQHCFLIPFRHAKTGKTYAQLVIGWRGLVHRAALASGARVEAHIVHAGELIKYSPTSRTNPIIHEPALDADDDDKDSIIGAYSIAFLTNGDVQAEWMSRTQIDRIRARSKAANDGPWVTDFSEMARKCPTRRLAKYLQMSGPPEEVARFGTTLDIDNLFDSKGQDEEDAPPPQIAAPAPQQEQQAKKRGRPPRAETQPQSPPAATAEAPPNAGALELCGLCKKEGHSFNDCPEGQQAEERPPTPSAAEDTRPDKYNAGVAQTEEQGTRNAQVAGSTPVAGSAPTNGDRPITDQEYDDLMAQARSVFGRQAITKAINLLEDNFGIGDFSQLKASQVQKCADLIARGGQ